MPGIPFPDIDPVAVQIGPLAIRWYSLAYIAGILLGWRYMRHLSRRWESPVSAEHLGDFILWAIFGIILGGRLGYVLFYNLDHYLAEPLQILVIWRGGMSFHGGLLGVIGVTWLFARRRSIPILALSDLIACAAPIGLLLGRIANFVNGELYGRVTDVPWAMVFPAGGPAPRHPSQIYEALLEGLALFTVLAILAQLPRVYRSPGLLTGVFFAGYGLARFIVEFVREPDAQLGFVFASLTMGQALSVPLFLFGGYLVLRKFLNPERHEVPRPDLEV